MNLSIIFLKAQKPGNIGALARSMKNFELSELILVQPQCDINNETMARAMHAKDIVNNARTIDSLDKIIKEFDLVIATSGKTGASKSKQRSVITPAQAAENYAKTDNKIAILLGPEDIGLTNKEIDSCDVLVTVPTSKKYPIMNITHAATILLYEFYQKKGTGQIMATRQQKQEILKTYEQIIKKLEAFKNKNVAKQSMKSTINKSTMTDQEVSVLAGVFKELYKVI